MPFVPFTKAHTNVGKDHGKSAPVAKPPVAKAVPVKKSATRVPKPSGMGPAGSAGYFDC